MGDGGIMFGAVPKKFWAAKYPCDENNMSSMAMRAVFIETENHKIIVDTGAGDKHLSKIKYYKPHEMKDLREEIGKLGVSPEEITDVVNSHLHFDHCGGNTVANEKGEIVPAFPNAVYHVSLAQWENYRKPTTFERLSFFADNIEPVLDAGQLHRVPSDTELFDGIHLKLYDGHTPGQIAVFFDTDDERFVYAGDIIPSSVHCYHSCLCAYDNNLTLAMDEKKRLYDLAKAENRTLLFYHDSYTPRAKAR
jgi:glyoxylase-like metal-dependent hydrolase (beta-lactamase superfamily II)